MKYLTLLIIFASMSLIAFSQPTTITYQGKLLDNSNLPINQVGLPITFAIYTTESGVTKLWPAGTAASKTVDVVQGLYSVTLGTGTGSDDAFTAGIFAGYSPWLEIVVDGSTLPRTPLSNVPFSLMANQLSSTGWASPGALGSATPNSGTFTALNIGTGGTNYTFPGARGTNGQVLQSNASGVLDWATLSTTPSGAAGGNLGGTYPNPSIASLPAISGANLTNLNASNISSGTVATARLGSGTPTGSNFLRGDGTWAVASGITGTGTNNYLTKWTTGGSVIGNSLFQDNGTSISINIPVSVLYQLYVYKQQLTVNGDGQHSLYGYRTRDSQNDGTGYSQITANTATTGFSFWGDLYTFGVGGWSYNDYSRTGGVLGAEVTGFYWGSLGYKSSGLLNYGVYGASAYASGTGYLTNNEVTGIGAGFFGGIIGSWSRGMIMGNVNSGELFASYNVGNEYTSGYSADLVKSNAGDRKVPAYSMTSTDLTIHTFGLSQIESQPVFVAFTPKFTSILGEIPVVTITPVGAPASLYIVNIEQNGFWVALAPSSIAEGISNVRFTWIAVGRRIDANQITEIPDEITDGNFDNNLNDVLFDENNKEQSGRSIWWDGSKIRFDNAPEIPKAPKVEPNQQ